MENKDEEELLRSVALQNAKSIMLARQRAEEELVQAKEALQRKTEELAHALVALQEQAEWLQVTLSSIGDAVITTDTEGRVISLNPVAEGLTGWTQSEAEGISLERVFHIVNEETRAPVESPAVKSRREGRIAGLANHTVLIAKDGTERAIDDSAAPIKDRHGNLLGIVLVFRDVTERRRAEELQLHLAAVVASSDDAIVSKNLDGIIRSWNAAAERIFGYTAAEAVGRSIGLIIPPERQEEERSILERLRRGQRLEHFETVRVSKQGRRIDISLTVSPVRDATGRIVGASKIARDITDRKRAEEENARLLAELKETDRRKDEFLAVLAHELRNPLAPIRNAVDIMRAQGPSMSEVQWARDVIDRQVEHMTRLIDDLLDVSRITRGKIELRTERIELTTAMNQAVEAARSLVQCKQHELTVALPPQAIYVKADRTRLAQITGNLLNNACKFMDHGGRIWLTVRREGEQAVIRVKDTGIGIAAEQLSRLFNMFVQLDTSLRRSQSGLGIGLALAQRLVELHGGKIEAFSDGPGKGSEFVVRLPVAEAPSEVAQSGTDGDDRAAASRKLRILVVDDNRDAADGLGKLLRMMGNKVHTAYDGLQALAAASTFLPNVVILDIGLPKLNGYEAGRRIRDELGKDVILIAVTGWGQENDRRRSKEAGFDYHVTKPVEFAALKKLLSSIEPPKN